MQMLQMLQMLSLRVLKEPSVGGDRMRKVRPSINPIRWAVAACLAASSLVVTAPAHAILEECGNIDLSAEAECELVVQGGCQGKCEPPRMEIACAGDLYIGCQGECSASAEASCTASCQGECEAECDVNPGEFSCEGRCEAECAGDCSASCQAESNQAECEAACKVTCGGECDASCEGTPPSAECEARCDASCDGECRAEANVDCQADCQASGFDSCKAELQGLCDVQCQRPEGALFCDGQFIDARSIDSCIQALEASLNIQVEGSADADCEGNTCEAKASGSASCAVAPGMDEPGQSSAWWGLGAALFLLQRRRRTNAHR